MAPLWEPKEVTSPALLSSDTAADMVGFDSSRIAPSFGRVIGPCAARSRKTARELSVRGDVLGSAIQATIIEIADLDQDLADRLLPRPLNSAPLSA